jgi:hypothetical protein
MINFLLEINGLIGSAIVRSLLSAGLVKRVGCAMQYEGE